MAVAIWAGQTSSGGLLVAATEEWCIAVVKDAAKKAMVNLGPKEQQGPKVAAARCGME